MPGKLVGMITTTLLNGSPASQEGQAGSPNTTANSGGAAATNGSSLASQNRGVASQGAEVAAQAARGGSQGPANAAGEVTMIPGGVRVPVLTGGWQTTEFLLSLVVLAGIFAALWCGKIDAGLASALLGLVATAYPGLRTWLKAQHLDKVAQVLAAQNGPHADVYHAAAAALAAVDAAGDESVTAGAAGVGTIVPAVQPAMRQAADPSAGSGQAAASTSGGVPPAAAIAVVGAALALGVLLAGCANAPYYVSGVDASVTTGPDGQGVTGGAVGLSIAPNPGFVPAPVNPAPVKSGTAGVKGSTITIPIPLPSPTPAGKGGAAQ